MHTNYVVSTYVYSCFSNQICSKSSSFQIIGFSKSLKNFSMLKYIYSACLPILPSVKGGGLAQFTL